MTNVKKDTGVGSICITLNDFIIKEVIGDTTNRSARIADLILKGWKAEMDQKFREQTLSKREDAVHQIQSGSSVTRFVNLMLSGECTQPLVSYGQLYGGLGWAE